MDPSKMTDSIKLFPGRKEMIYMGYYFRLAARDLLYAPSHRQDSTYNGLCYTSRGVDHEGLIISNSAGYWKPKFLILYVNLPRVRTQPRPVT